MLRFLILLMGMCSIGLSASWAQCTLSFSGHINDAETKEHLENAVITIVELNLSQTARSDGSFVFKGLCPGLYTVKVSHASCQSVEFHFHLKNDLEKDFELNHVAAQLGEVVVTGNTSRSSPASELKGKALEASRGLSLQKASNASAV